MTDDISNFPPPPVAAVSAVNSDISGFPEPLTSVANSQITAESSDISNFPPPPTSSMQVVGTADISNFPPPPKTTDTEEGTSWHTADIHSAELNTIAKKWNTDPRELVNMAPYYNAFVKGQDTNPVKQTAGFASESLGGIPTWIYKKFQDPNTRGALDDLRELAEGKKSTIQKGSEMIAPVAAAFAGLPIGLPAEAGILGATAEGAAYGVGSSKEGEELPSAAVGAAFGASIHSVAKLLGKFAGRSEKEANAIRGQQAKITEDADKIAADTVHSEDIIAEHVFTPDERRKPLTPEEANVIVKEQVDPRAVAHYEQIEGRQGPPSQMQLAEDVIATRKREFTEQLGADPLEHASRQGDEATVNSYNDYVKYKQAEKAVDAMDHGARDQPGFWTGLVNKLSDNQYALRRLDDKYGIDSEAVLRELNKAKNRLTFARADTRSQLEQIHKEAVANGSDSTVIGGSKIVDAMESGDLSKLTPGEQQTAVSFQKYFDHGRDYANGLVQGKDPGISPLNIPKEANYVPHVALPTHKMIPLIEAKVPLALEEASRYLSRPVKQLSELSAQELEFLAKAKGEIADLVGFHEWNTGRSGVDGKQLSKDLDATLHTSQGNVALESKARAAMERTGEMPDFLREKNLYKLADTWAHNTYNHLFLRRGLERMSYEADKLRKFGATKEAEYIDTIIRDTLGIRPGTAAEGFLRANTTLERSIQPIIDRVGATSPTGLALTAVKNTPDIMYGLMRNIYGNVLGVYNMYAATQNLVTGFTRLAPELGGKYGYATVMRGVVRTLLSPQHFYEMAEHMGNVPAGFGREGEAALAEGLFRSKAFNLPKEAYSKLSEWGMKLFETSEKFNRALTLATSDMIAADIAHGSPAAMNSLSKYPMSIQRRIAANPADQAGNSKLLGQYLNDTTQFNYNRSSLFEFGRTLGPVLSTFSKWPTAILGEAAYTYRSHGLGKGTLRNMERLIIPYILLSTVQYGLQKAMHVDSPQDMPDRAKKFLGSNGMQAMSPVGALSKFATGEIFSPPAVDLLVKQLLIPAFKGDAGGVGKGLDTALHNYAPGAGFVRFFTDDMVTYLTGHKPEGSTFTERTIEGARKLGIK